jgi:hypothetical protein
MSHIKCLVQRRIRCSCVVAAVLCLAECSGSPGDAAENRPQTVAVTC